MRARITILAAVLTVFVGAVPAEEIQRSDFSGMVYMYECAVRLIHPDCHRRRGDWVWDLCGGG